MFKKVIQKMLILAGIFILAIVLTGGGYWIFRKNQTGKPAPVVSIHSPGSGTEIGLDETLIIQSTSHDQGAYISGVELWVSEGGFLSLLDRSTPLKDSHSFSLSQGWQPSKPGTSRFIVRAFNTQGNYGQAALDIQVVVKPEEEQVTGVNVVIPPVAEGTESILLDLTGYAGNEPAESVEGEGGEGEGEEAEEEQQGGIPFPPDPDPNTPFPPDFLVGMFNLVIEPFILIDLNDILVEVEALSLTVEEEYTKLYCYVGLGNNPAERVPDAGSFVVSNTYEWNLADYLAGNNKISIIVPQDQDLKVYLECFGINNTSNFPIPLGIYKHSHPSQDWNGQIFEGVSEYGEGFVVTYRMNAAAGPLEAPINLQQTNWGGNTNLQWIWEGNLHDIDGYRIYRNNSLVATVDPEYMHLEIPSWWTVPPCQEEYIYKVKAYQDDLESAPSNELTYQGEPCGGENDIINIQSQPICEGAGRRFDVSYRYQSPHGLAAIELRAYGNGELIDVIQSTRPQIQHGEGTALVAVMDYGETGHVTDQITVTLSDQNDQPFYVETFDQLLSWIPVEPDLIIPSAWVDREFKKIHVQIENSACAGPPVESPLEIPMIQYSRVADGWKGYLRLTEDFPARTQKMIHIDLNPQEMGPEVNLWDGEIKLVVDPEGAIDESYNDNNEYTISPVKIEKIQFTKIDVIDDHDYGQVDDGEWTVYFRIARYHDGECGYFDWLVGGWDFGPGEHTIHGVNFYPNIAKNDALVFIVEGYERDWYFFDDVLDPIGTVKAYHSPDGIPIPELDNKGYILMGSWKSGGSYSVPSHRGDYQIFYELVMENN
jgi:hypothetical protein